MALVNKKFIIHQDSSTEKELKCILPVLVELSNINNSVEDLDFILSSATTFHSSNLSDNVKKQKHLVTNITSEITQCYTEDAFNQENDVYLVHNMIALFQAKMDLNPLSV